MNDECTRILFYEHMVYKFTFKQKQTNFFSTTTLVVAPLKCRYYAYDSLSTTTPPTIKRDPQDAGMAPSPDRVLTVDQNIGRIG